MTPFDFIVPEHFRGISDRSRAVHELLLLDAARAEDAVCVNVR